jgi:uncharacterized protein YndB with AHSA1/START domain
MSQSPTTITVKTTIHAPINKVWKCWTEPVHVMNWNHASDDWHTPHAENDLSVGGKFSYTMAAKDGSFSFDFWGNYTDIQVHESITIKLGDDRNLHISFVSDGDITQVTETFDAEDQNPAELQQIGWQAILDNFKKYTESI